MDKIAIVRLDKIGDLILTTPAIATIRATFPESHITAIVNSYNKVVLENSTDIDEIWEWTWNIQNFIKLRKAGFAKVIVFSPTSPSFWLAYFSIAKRRLGYIYASRVIPSLLAPVWFTKYSVDSIDQKNVNDSHQRVIHEVEQNLQVLKLLDVDIIWKNNLCVSFCNDVLEWAKSALPGSGWVGIHFSPIWAKGLPPYFFVDLVSELAKTKKVCITSGEKIEFSFDRFDDRVRVFDHLSFSHWGALLRQADVVISPNTGSLHLAASQRRPVVAILEPEFFYYHMKRWAPWQVPSRILRKDDPGLLTKIIESVSALVPPV